MKVVYSPDNGKYYCPTGSSRTPQCYLQDSDAQILADQLTQRFPGHKFIVIDDPIIDVEFEDILNTES